MAHFELVTVWRVRSPLSAVWEAISHSERWPEWWPGVESVLELDAGDADGIGNLRRFTWKGVLPYRLTFDIRTTRIEPQRMIEGLASGDVVGAGSWRFAPEGDATVVRYEWLVRTTKGWMDVLARFARPLVVWNHHTVMGWGAKGLARRLGAGTSCRPAGRPAPGRP